MKIFGIIAEFNPFHNGHKYFIDEIKNNYNPDIIVGVLSSAFVQRGEPGLLNKWERAKLASLHGVNLVLELPFVFACQNAEIFAKGGIKILNDAGVNNLVFGVEDDSIEDLIRIAKITSSEDNIFRNKIKKYLDEGKSFIESRNNAYIDSGLLSEQDVEIISKSNNILGVEYIKAGMKINPTIKFHSIVRYKSSHDSKDIIDEYASASKIRQMLKNSISIERLVPKISNNALLNNTSYSEELLFSILKYNFINCQNSIKNTLEYEKGIENRISKYLDSANSIEELAELSCSKRITKSRIRRIIINSLVRVAKKDSFMALKANPYLRILAIDDIGRKYIKNLDVNYITNFKEIKKASPSVLEIANIENRASNLYSIINNQNLNIDFTTNPFVL